MTGHNIKIMDVRTRQEFVVPAANDREFIVTRDGERVRVHPTIIKLMVRVGRDFDGHTTKGTRPLQRLA